MVRRRDLLIGGTALGAAALAAGRSPAFGARATAAKPKRVVLGVGRHRYEWVRGWGTLPEGLFYGNTHGGIVVDGRGLVYVNTDGDNAVIVLDADGRFVKAWGKIWAGGLHGMALVREGAREVLYLAHTGRHEVAKCTLDGDVLATLPFPATAGVYEKPDQYKPTGVAVAENGNVYVGDGYGRSYVHQYAPDGSYVRSWGGKGAEPGKFNTPHGVWVDTRRAPHTLIVCDRENHRLQIFDLDGKLLGMVEGVLDRPCGLHQRGDDLAVADLRGRVTLLDKDNQLIAHLGEQPDDAKKAQNRVDRVDWKDGEFISPHSCRWDAKGNLYVMDWNYLGRVTKLKRL